MKKILLLFFIFLNFLSFNIKVHAQCSTVTVALYSPSAGSYKVRATIAYPYSQNIEIMGSITPEGESMTGFELTIYAGNLTGETDQTWVQSNPPSFSASYISSCPPPNPTNANNPYDYIGEQHNSVLDYAYANMSLPATSEDDIFDIVADYYSTLSIDTIEAFFDSTKATIHEFQTVTNICSTFLAKGFSSGFNSYYNSIDYLLDNASTLEDFLSSMISLEGEISSSALSTSEKAILLASAAIYRYSGYYWSVTGRIEDWETKAGTVAYLNENNPTRFQKWSPSYANYVYITSPYWFSWKSVLKADGHGAIQGGVAGFLAAGPLAGVTGAVVWGSGVSVDNILTQVWHWLF